MDSFHRPTAALVTILLFTAAGTMLPGFSDVSHPTTQPAQRTAWMTVGGGNIEVDIEAGNMDLSRTELLDWVRTSAIAVSRYFGRFPVKKALIKIVPRHAAGIGFSTTTYERDAGVITVPVGRHTTVRDLADDWVLTHEMIHFGFPLTSDKHRWLAEGMATYVEPLARMRTGLIPAQEVWGDLVRMLPQGLPEPGDRGLDHTPSWGRTYWGGALYFLLADLEIRRRTNNRRGLEDALGAIARAGGNIASDWEPVQALEVGDRAVGTTVLTDLYNRMKQQPVAIDLPRMWALLGVSSKEGTIVFNDRAPLAHLRRAINRGSFPGRPASKHDV